MEDKNINELLSAQALEGSEILSHISYWSGEFKYSTKEDLDLQKKELKEYPIIIYSWNEKTRELLKKCSDNLILSDFIEGDEKLVALKDVDSTIDDGYRSREALSADNDYDPAKGQYSADSQLSIISGVIKNKIKTIKTYLNKPSDNVENKLPKKNSIKTLDLLKKHNGGLDIFVNGNYFEVFSPNNTTKDNSSWGRILEIAEEGKCEYDDQLLRYFNSNSKNPLYAKLKYEKTRILNKEKDWIVPVIEIKIVTRDHINRSKGQKIKN